MVEQYKRCRKISIINDYSTVPQAYFFEELITIAPEEEPMKIQTDIFVAELIQPEQKLVLRHPETDEVLGEATDAQIHVILYSLYKRESEKNEANKNVSA